MSASAVVIHYEEALYQLYAPLPLPYLYLYLPWPKTFVTGMLTRDVFAVANLLVAVVLVSKSVRLCVNSLTLQ